MKLQIIDWSVHFENSKSRERDHCSFVCVPNKQDGMGLTRMLQEPDGAAIYGIWCLILGAASRQKRVRDGYLTDTGRADGGPWSVEDMAMRWRRPVVEVQRAVDYLLTKAQWIQDLDDSTRPVPAECPPSALEEKRREEKGNEKKRRNFFEPVEVKQ